MCIPANAAPTQPTCPAALVAGLQGPYREVALRRSNEVEPLLEEVAAAMARLDYPEPDRHAVRLVLIEAITNGLKHGNGGDPAKHVRVGYHVGRDAVILEVQDEGPGFDPAAVPDPTLPENLDRPNGRGLLLMRHFMTSVRFWGRGNLVTLCKRPSA
jgi:serine/threonine-protein kinase RsbW